MSYHHSIAELEATRQATSENQIAGWRERDLEVWRWLVDPSERERRIKQEAEAEASQPKGKPAPEPSNGARYLTMADVPQLAVDISKWLSKPYARMIAGYVKAQISRFADSERVSALDMRILDLEARLGKYEGRMAAHDTAIAAHRKHLSNLEIKHNDLRRAMNGEPRGVERVEQ